MLPTPQVTDKASFPQLPAACHPHRPLKVTSSTPQATVISSVPTPVVTSPPRHSDQHPRPSHRSRTPTRHSHDNPVSNWQRRPWLAPEAEAERQLRGRREKGGREAGGTQGQSAATEGHRG